MVQNFIADGVDRNMLARLAKLQGSNDLDLLIKRFDPGKFPVTGDDLIAKGMKPGPELGKTLADLRNKWKQSDFKATKKDLLGEHGVYDKEKSKRKFDYKQPRYKIKSLDDILNSSELIFLSPGPSYLSRLDSI